MKRFLSLFFKPKNPLKNIEENIQMEMEKYKRAREIFYAKESRTRNTNESLLLFDEAIKFGIVHAFADRAFCLQGLQYHYDAILDFSQAIFFSENEANLYYGRGYSKKIITDYEGAIIDLKIALELSQISNELNHNYDDEITRFGYSSVSEYYNSQLIDTYERKECCKNENLADLYKKIANDIVRRNQ